MPDPKKSAMLDAALPDAPDPNVSSSVSPAVFQPPPKPQVPKPDWTGRLLTMADVGTRALDAYSTRRMLQGPNHEKFLPDAISGSNLGMGLYSGGMAGLNWLAQHELQKHGHPKLAHALQAVDIGATLPYALNNLRLPTRGK